MRPSFDQFRDRLRRRLAAALPGRAAQRAFEPELACGRHFSDPPAEARRAGVLALLYPDQNEWRVALTLRPQSLPAHPGQISFPGGMVESGEDARAAALRELEEELGVPAAAVEVVGALSPLYVFNSHVGVAPWVGLLPQRPSFSPNPSEVEELLEPPLARLADPRYHRRLWIERGGLRFAAPHMEWRGHGVWGATAMILAELVCVVGQAAD